MRQCWLVGFAWAYYEKGGLEAWQKEIIFFLDNVRKCLYVKCIWDTVSKATIFYIKISEAIGRLS
jgi:hypothetical protein